MIPNDMMDLILQEILEARALFDEFASYKKYKQEQIIDRIHYLK